MGMGMNLVGFQGDKYIPNSLHVCFIFSKNY